MIDYINSDAVEWARNYSGELYHALLCDPPYHLYEPNSAKSSFAERMKNGRTDEDKALRRGGFMGKTWDGGDVAFSPDTWAAFASVLHPGAFGMAFASARGWHRLACAIEDAGLIIHPSLFGWAYGSGFPKATRIDTQIDKAEGAERKVIGKTVVPKQFMREVQAEMGYRPNGKPYAGEIDGRFNAPVTAPATFLARAFVGHRYGLQALKPALEPIIVFQKPYQGKPVECITRTGAGAINIDAGRIGVDPDDKLTSAIFVGSNPGSDGYTMGDGWQNQGDNVKMWNGQGRWPANFILLDDAAAAALDEQSGILKSGAIKPHHNSKGLASANHEGWKRPWHENAENIGWDVEASEGGASRFFFRVEEQIDEADPVYYCAKASRKERDAGLESMPLTIRRTFGDMGPDENARPNGQGDIVTRNPHPTVKPIALARYLATLLLPPAEYAPRRLLVPFAGVASECIGAHQAGWEEITGIDSDTEHGYAEIAEARIMHHCAMFA